MKVREEWKILVFCIVFLGDRQETEESEWVGLCTGRLSDVIPFSANRVSCHLLSFLLL